LLGGIGRTGATVGCWLVRHGLTGGQALTRLNELYRVAEQSRIISRSPETDARLILSWDGWKMEWHKRFVQQAAWTRELRLYLFKRAGMPTARRVLEVAVAPEPSFLA